MLRLLIRFAEWIYDQGITRALKRAEKGDFRAVDAIIKDYEENEYDIRDYILWRRYQQLIEIKNRKQ